MVEKVQSRSEVYSLTAGASTGRIGSETADDFGPLLSRLLGTAVSASNSTTSCLPGRPNLSQALHCLAVQMQPQPTVLFSPTQNAHSMQTLANSAQRAQRLQQALGLSSTTDASRPMSLSDYPRPAEDNGRGVHWIPTTSQTPEVVDRFVERAKALGTRWVTFLNEPGDLTGNTYLVKKLASAGIMPIMRVYTESGQAIQQDITPLVKKYRGMGVSYFQLFNEPNLSCENGGQAPDVQRHVDEWLTAAKQVVKAGGLPGLGSLSPQGDVDDVEFLKQFLAGVKQRGDISVLNTAWVSVHNYGTNYLKVRQYDEVVEQALGRSLPMVGTEAGIYPGGGLTEADQIRVVSEAYRYMGQSEPYYFAYSLWALANQAGGGHDARWEHQALYRLDGPSALAQALEQEFGEA